MKKIAGLSIVSFTFLANALPALAQVNITPRQPNAGINIATSPSTVITNILTIVFAVSILLVLFFLIIGAFQWITSGGEKEKVGKARSTIIHALVGLAVLALAFLIINVAGGILNIHFNNLILPRLDQT